jgi:hypothetical protein
MSIIRITASIYVDTEGRDREDVWQSMDSGLEHALAHFPDGEVIQADVESARELDAAEISEKGFEE